MLLARKWAGRVLCPPTFAVKTARGVFPPRFKKTRFPNYRRFLDEVRYIIDGEGIFGFVRPDGTQIELTIQPQEYINVPAGCEHWFYLTSARRIKAIRYFIGKEGWVPQYTGREKVMGKSLKVKA